LRPVLAIAAERFTVTLVSTRHSPRQFPLHPAPSSICVSFDVQEPGGHASYFQPVGFVLDPDGAQRATREAAGLTFRISASSFSKTRLVGTEVVVSRGAGVVSRYHSVTALPLSGTGTP
jgi:hypothetical protein